jgi:hypothetical protein
MLIEIKPRRDGLLKEDRTNLENSAADYLLEVTYPTHEMLLRFLNKYVVGKKFENEAELQETLDKWPAFAKENNFELKSEWSKISADFLNEYISCGEDLDNGLIIGFIHALTN